MTLVYTDEWFMEGTNCDSAHLRLKRSITHCVCGHGKLRHDHRVLGDLGACDARACGCPKFAADAMPDDLYPCQRCNARQLPENLDEDGNCDVFTRRGWCKSIGELQELKEAEDD